MEGYITKGDKNVSSYQPPTEVALLTKEVKKDYDTGIEILQRQWIELNDRSVIDDENNGQMMFNAFVDDSVEDPAQAWKWRGTRSMARNKGIAMHANLTANFILPMFTAQNDQDEVDRDFSEVMRDIIEWMSSPSNSNYHSSFLQVTMGMMTNPVTYLGAEYYEVYQTIKEKTKDGKYVKKEILDEVLSGFQAPVWSSSQILITNAYERNIQKQKCIIKRRYVERSELEALYGKHPNWQYVKDGIKTLYSDDDNRFYDVKDDDHPTLVSEEVYLNRMKDIEVPFVNGIYMGDEDVEANPIRHRDNKGAPKYNVIPFGYARIGEHFYFFKSMMNIMHWDNNFYDAMTEVVMNRALLEVDMPVVVSGSDQIDSDVIFPNAVVTLENENARVTPMLPNSNMAAGLNALRETEKSISEGSINETISGNLPDASQKAFNVAQAQQAAKKLIGNVAKSIVESVTQYGSLMKDIAINHITAPQVEELVSGNMKLKYRTFIVENKTSVGNSVTKKVKFDESLIGTTMSPEEKKEREISLAIENGYPENNGELRLINPEMFAKFNYYAKCDAEEIFTKNQEYWQPVLLNLKAALANDPYTNQEALTKKIMYAYFQSGGDDMMAEPAPTVPTEGEDTAGGNAFGSMVQNKALNGAAKNAGMI